MTAREVIRSLVNNLQDLEKEIIVIILERDQHGVVIGSEEVAVTRVSYAGNILCVEKSDLRKTK